jgi:hypothetical protein
MRPLGLYLESGMEAGLRSGSIVRGRGDHPIGLMSVGKALKVHTDEVPGLSAGLGKVER